MLKDDRTWNSTISLCVLYHLLLGSFKHWLGKPTEKGWTLFKKMYGSFNLKCLSSSENFTYCVAQTSNWYLRCFHWLCLFLLILKIFDLNGALDVPGLQFSEALASAFGVVSACLGPPRLGLYTCRSTPQSLSLIKHFSKMHVVQPGYASA